MATFTDNFALAKPTYGELADVAVINGNMDTIDGIMHSNRTMLAPAFSQTEDYAVGDVVVYEGNLYRFIVPHTAGNWDGTEVEQTTLGEEISTKGGADVTKTASGNPITFDDGADAPLVKCTTEIQGSQDLHGYDKPWVGGAGKNKLPNIMESPQTVNGITATPNDDGTITINGTATANTNIYFNNRFILPQGSYIFSGSNGGSSSTYGLFLNNGSDNLFVYDGEVSFTSDGVTQIYVAIRVVSGVTVNNVKLYPMLRASGTTADFAPYSNICPISGYSSVGVNVVGKNLFDKTTYTFTSEKYVSLSTGNIGTNSSYACTEAYIPCSNLVGQTITLNQIPGGTQPGMAFYDSSNGYISGGKGDAITVPSNAVYYRFTVPIAYASGDDVQIELGSTATTYEPYAGHTYTISLGGTYYSGQIDAVRGVLVADKAEFICDGTESGWGKSTTTDCDVYMASTPFSDFNFDNVYMTDKFAYAPERNYNRVGYTWRGSSNKQLRIGFSEYNTSTLADFKTWLGNNPLQIVADLATPIEIPLTPTVISSLLGNNTMWTDGDNLSVEYITEEFQPLVDLIEIGNGHTYSTSEQIVGKWTNGKDVYEKTIYYATLSCDRNDWAQLEALDAETFISYSATAHMETASGRQIDNNYIRISYYNGYLYHHEPEFGTGMVDLYVTVRYTKPSSNTRSLNLTKSAVEEIPDEIKNAEYEEKPDVNEADDDAPTEVDER